jgi:hypothetical protein
MSEFFCFVVKVVKVVHFRTEFGQCLPSFEPRAYPYEARAECANDRRQSSLDTVSYFQYNHGLLTHTAPYADGYANEPHPPWAGGDILLHRHTLFDSFAQTSWQSAQAEPHTLPVLKVQAQKG